MPSWSDYWHSFTDPNQWWWKALNSAGGQDAPATPQQHKTDPKNYPYAPPKPATKKPAAASAVRGMPAGGWPTYPGAATGVNGAQDVFTQRYNQLNELLPPAPTGMTLDLFGSQISPAYRQAMATVNQRYDNAAKQVALMDAKAQKSLGLLPDKIKHIFTQGPTSMQANTEATEKAAGKLPEGYALPVSTEHGGFDLAEAGAPAVEAMQGMQADRIADVDLLSLGTQQLVSNQNIALEQARAQQIAEIERERANQLAGFAAQQGSDQARYNLERQSQILGLLSPILEQQAAAGGRFGSQEEEDFYWEKQAGTREVSLDHGVWLYQRRPEVYGKVLQSTNAKKIQEELKTIEWNEQTLPGILQELGEKYNAPTTASALLYFMLSQLNATGGG